jgi:antitoxin ParD1/3/4
MQKPKSRPDAVQGGSRLLREQSGQLEQLRSALIEAEQSGPSAPFDRDAFKARMHAKHAPSKAAK